MRNKVELLAPAGSWEALVAAINNGADAVYLGGKNFSARAFANNFDHDELIKAVNYAHELNVKVYITLNTLITDFEFENVKKEIDFLYSINVDALIIQDLGVYYYIKNSYPDFELHASTQMHIHNLNGVINAKKLGFKRAVIARESSLNFIKEACKQGIEIETFVHGAICVSYSGQCLMSSVTKSRSANKGMCAQCCRLSYELKEVETNKSIKTDTPYLLSPKDMMLIDEIPDLIKAGVSSFKIEGRMKSPAYVGYITHVYRKAIDSYYDGSNYKLTEDELKNIKYLFNRNFTDTYLLNDSKDLFGQDKPNHLGVEIGRVIRVLKDSILIRLTEDLHQYDGIRIVSGNKEYGQIVNFLSIDGKYENQALKGQVCEIKCNEKIKFNDIVYKTISHILEEKINSIKHKKININIDVNKDNESNINILAYNESFKFNYVSNIKTLDAIKAPVDKENFLKHFTLNESAYSISNCTYNLNNVFIPVKQINELKHNFIEAINTYRINQFNRESIPYEINFSNNLSDDISILDSTNSIKIVNPVINNSNNYKESNINLITEVGGLLLNFPNKIASYTLNIANSYAYEMLIKLGFKGVILSTELSSNEVNELVKRYKERNMVSINPIILANTCRTLMYLRRNPFSTYITNLNKYELTDGTNKYSINSNSDFIEVKETSDFENKAILKDFKRISLE